MSSDWHQGYGYQFWRCRHEAYRGDGAYGQFCIVAPSRDAVILITSHTQNMQGLLDEVWKHLLPAMYDATLARPASSKQLQRELASMAVQAPAGQIRTRPLAQETFSLESNAFGALRASFDLRDDFCVLRLEFSAEVSEVRCGIGEWIENVIDIPGTPPKFISQGERRALRVAAAAFWEDAHTLKMQWRYYETPNYDLVTCRFEGDAVTIEFMSDTVALSEGQWSEDRPRLKGHRTSVSVGHSFAKTE